MGNCLKSSSAPPPRPLLAPIEKKVEQSKKPLPTHGLKAFSWKELIIATKKFHDDNLIRIEGPYVTFKGWISEQTLSPSKPESGMPVSVKQLELDVPASHYKEWLVSTFQFVAKKLQVDVHVLDRQNEWLAKIKHVSQLHHPNLVKIIGYCLENEITQLRFLVTEFMPKGCLDNHLRGNEGDPPLSWEKRMKVAIGAAKGLCFLHDAQPQVIYRYLDASNVLLDADYNAKLSAHLSTQVMDIRGFDTEGYSLQGYAAPEFINIGLVTAKSDVYSFGVLLLVLLTGQSGMVNSRTTLVDWVSPFPFRRNVKQIMDTKMKNYSHEAAVAVVELALECTYGYEDGRPNMSDVVRRLEEAVRPKK